jgi:hypothetical protein
MKTSKVMIALFSVIVAVAPSSTKCGFLDKLQAAGGAFSELENPLTTWETNTPFNLPLTSKQANPKDVIVTSVLASVISNAIISKDNSLAKVIIGGLTSFAGAAAASKLSANHKYIALAVYLIGQNSVQIGSAVLTKNPIRVLLDFLTENREPSELVAFVVRTFATPALHATDKGSELHTTARSWVTA